MTTEPEVYERLRAKTANLLGFDLTNLSALKALRLDRATLLRLELDRLQAQQAAGEAVDLNRIALASAQLEALLPPEDDAPALDLALLSDEELSLFETLVAKAMGTAPPMESPESQPDTRADLLARMSTEVDELRRANTTLTVQLETAENRLKHVEAHKAAEEVDAAPPPGPRIVVDNGSPYWR
jgi:hypothetical protein